MLFYFLSDLLSVWWTTLSTVRSWGASLFSTLQSQFGYTGAVCAVSLLVASGVYGFVYAFSPKISSFTPVTGGWTASKKRRNFEHIWVTGDMLLFDHDQGPMYCNACSSLVLQGITCLVCRRCAHQEHHHLVEDMPCKRMYNFTDYPSILGVVRQKSKEELLPPISDESIPVSSTMDKTSIPIRRSPRVSSNTPPIPPATRRPSRTSTVTRQQSKESVLSVASSADEMPRKSVTESESLDYDHQWAEGNLSLNARCPVCYASAGGEPTLKDLRCIWCDVAVHTQCFSQYRTKCPLGVFPDLVVPPQSVTRVSKATRGSSKKNSSPRFIIDNLPEGSHPIICVVNPASGAQNSAALLAGLFGLLNPVQIVDTSQENPESIIRAFEPVIERCRVLACGGDGTIQWVQSLLDKVVTSDQRKPPVGILPLGTGNDLARVLGWGGGWTGEDVKDIVRDIDNAEEVLFDRWSVVIAEEEVPLTSTAKVSRALYLTSKKQQKTMVMNNYFSAGTDASVALEFHETRLKQPQLFRSRLINKIWYAFLGGKHQFLNALSFVGLQSGPTLVTTSSPAHSQGEAKEADKTSNSSVPNNANVDVSSTPKVETVDTRIAESPSPGAHEPLASSSLRLDGHSEDVDLSDLGALIVLNIPSYGGGGKIYAQAEAEGQPPCRFSDGQLEVLAVASPLHLGASVVGLASPAVIGQAKKIEVHIGSSQVAMQVDGEPWRQKGPCTVTISHLCKTKMLKKSGVQDIKTRKTKRAALFRTIAGPPRMHRFQRDRLALGHEADETDTGPSWTDSGLETDDDDPTSDASSELDVETVRT
ncbi:ATP-NAD kinase-like domain-containing protein [Phlyctochytrium arcticum]|nr:ATP-NAD kinase-like domain-containing protein [Phlyctochytrium arcticum]